MYIILNYVKLYIILNYIKLYIILNYIKLYIKLLFMSYTGIKQGCPSSVILVSNKVLRLRSYFIFMDQCYLEYAQIGQM